MIAVVEVCVCTLSWRGCWEGYRGATTRVGGGRWSEVSRWETGQTPFGCRRRRCGKRRRQLEATAQSSAWGGTTTVGDGRRRRTAEINVGGWRCRLSLFVVFVDTGRKLFCFPPAPVRPLSSPLFLPPSPFLFFCDSSPPKKCRTHIDRSRLLAELLAN
jgi:hypothetical protein